MAAPLKMAARFNATASRCTAGLPFPDEAKASQAEAISKGRVNSSMIHSGLHFPASQNVYAMPPASAPRHSQT